MIQAHELRVGNWVDFISKPNTPEQVSDIYTHDVPSAIVNRIDISDIVGIPLTEEWMRRFGFERKIENTGAPIHEDMESYVLDGYEFSEDCDGAWFLCGYNWNTKHFKYVHELQNIFYALSGEELPIKIPS